MRDLVGSPLLFVTCLASLDGTIFMLAASGILSSWQGATAAGLLSVAGVSVWITARQAYPDRPRKLEWLQIALIASVSSVLSVAAAAAGQAVAGLADEFVVLPHATAAALLLLAITVAGAPVPHVKRVPLQLVILAFAVPLEVAIQWRL